MNLGSYEWIILEVGFLGLLVWELVSVRRSIRRAKADEAQVKASAGRETATSPGPTAG